MNNTTSLLSRTRSEFHKKCIEELLVIDSFRPKSGPSKGRSVLCASNADGGNEASRFIANHVADALGAETGKKLKGQTSGNRFELLVADFVRSSFLELGEFRPGKWSVVALGSRQEDIISSYEQYSHIRDLTLLSKRDKVLRSSLGNDYTIAPDVIVAREKYSDEEINSSQIVIDDQNGLASSLRSALGPSPILHASVSCKWTMRSDRAQNARSEALNLIRNRKGRTPHIVAVVGEPSPSRLASIALGTGDLDCVYHFALHELRAAVSALGQSEAEDLLSIMIEGKRLRDIADLPLDLCV